MIEYGWHIAVSMASVAGVFAGLVLLRRLYDGLHRRFVGFTDSRGTEIGVTPASRFAAPTPLAVAIIANAGTGVRPRQTLNMTILRPSIGLRLFTFFAIAAISYFLWVDPAYRAGMPPSIKLWITGLVAYFAVYLSLYELRYDAEMVEAPDWVLRKRTYRWDDVISIADTGQQRYRLKFEDGRKIDVIKYLVGIRDFLTIAQMHVEANRRF